MNAAAKGTRKPCEYDGSFHHLPTSQSSVGKKAQPMATAATPNSHNGGAFTPGRGGVGAATGRGVGDSTVVKLTTGSGRTGAGAGVVSRSIRSHRSVVVGRVCLDPVVRPDYSGPVKRRGLSRGEL